MLIHCYIWIIQKAVVQLPLVITRKTSTSVYGIPSHILPCTYQRSVWLRPGCYCSVAKLCPTLCDPMDYSTPGFPVHHQLLELAQNHGHWVGDAIQRSHSLLSPPPPAFNVSSIRVFSSESVLHISLPKYWSFSFSISPSKWIFRVDFLYDWLVGLLAVQGTLKSFSSNHVWMWELDYKESWVPKNWCFWTVVLEKSLGLQGDQTSQS